MVNGNISVPSSVQHSMTDSKTATPQQGVWLLQLIVGLLLCPVQQVFANEPLPTVLFSGYSLGYFAKLVLALVAVLVFFLLFAWALRRSQHIGSHQSADLRIVASMSLGTRERVVVVQAGAQQVLLGITPTHINSLTVLESPLEVAGVQDDPSFRTTLERLLGKSTGSA